MDISVVPKWVWFVIALAVLGGIAGVGIYAVHTYNSMTTKLAQAVHDKNDATEANATLKTENDRLKQDVKDREDTKKNIDESQKQVAAVMDGLSKDLEKAIAERDKARREAQTLAGGVGVCKQDDAFSTVPTERDIGLDFAWAAYCKANPKSQDCLVTK